MSQPRIVQGQVAIAVTGTAVQFPANANLVDGVVVTAYGANSGDVFIGGSTVTNTGAGTGNGYILSPGQGGAFAVLDSSQLWLNGSAGDFVSFVGD